VLALDDVSFTVAAGQTLAVVGPSGCGKTTLLELICGLQVPDAGSVQLQPAALMPQRDLLLPWLCAIDNACLALRVAGVPQDAARTVAAPWFERLGLHGFEQARVSELSGGMRQRVSFLRTLLAGKPVLALDEPFAALDALTRAEAQGWLAEALAHSGEAPGGMAGSGVAGLAGSGLAEPGVGGMAGAGGRRTVVLVTHDVEEAVLLGDRVAVMSPRPGRVVESLAVDLPRPRVRTDPAVVELRARVMEVLHAAS